MRVEDVSPALRRQLGPEAADGLLGTLDQVRHEWTEGLMTRVADRFELRLTEELSGLRVEFREALTIQRAELREAIAGQGAGFREALAAQGAGLRTTIAEQGAALRSEIATSRTDIVRWLFIFWTGQLIALAALLTALQ
jgi:hypothetical protein